MTVTQDVGEDTGTPPPHGTVRAVLVDAAVVLGAFALAGAVAGLVWVQLVDPVLVRRTEEGIVTDELALSRRFDSDAWFAVLGGAAGLVLGLVLTSWRRTHEVATVLLVLAGAALAAGIAAATGAWWGPDDPALLLQDAAPGATAPTQVRITSDAVYLAWPIGAMLGAVASYWSPHHAPAPAPAPRAPDDEGRRR